MDGAALRTWFDEQTAGHLFSGVARAWTHGHAVFSYHGGLAHRGHSVPIDERTRFGVASVTKMATAIAVLRLVDRGLVRLDQPLVEILPLEHRPVALTAEHRLHHLLSHTSGLANYFDEDDESGRSFTSCWDRIPTYRVRRPADLLPLFRDLRAGFAPGERYEYNDANFVLAGLALEALTGQPYARVMADEVFSPAGMTDTAIEALDDDPERLAVGYVMDEGPPERWRSNCFSVPATGMPDGGMITTATDLARMVDALLGHRLLSPELVRAMMTPQGPPSMAVQQWGYGCELAMDDGVVAIFGHGGSDPGVSARVSHYIASGTTIVAICNQDRGSWTATVAIAEALGLPDPRT